MRKQALLFVLLLGGFSALHAQTINDLFSAQTSLSRNYHSVARNYQSLKLDRNKLSALKSQAPHSLELDLPFENGQLKLQLEKVNITSSTFSVVEALPGNQRRTVTYPGASFYHGKVAGTSSSFATISLFGDQVMGIISDNQSNIILGSIENNGNPTDEYTLYRETDMAVQNPLSCFTTDDAAFPTHPTTNTAAKLDAVGAPVEIYFECDNRLYLDKGSNTVNLINYVLGFFNNTALLYANENIKIQVSQILVWTTTDPEAAAGLNTTSTVLNAFSTRMINTSYIGDFAHFISTRSLGGGVAWLNSPCPGKFNRCAVSAIFTTYSNFPTYSWTVQVVTHELGHNLGSHHSHWCGWPGGPIDGCGPTANAGYAEGTCPNGPLPASGTIMSYCHLLGMGINFNNGFGPLPGQAIRDFVTNSPCLATCSMTIDITKQDASCGQPNGSATVTATGSTGALSYLWSNGQTSATLSGVGPGTYHVAVKDAGGCQVMKDVVITNAGTTLTFGLTPNGNGGFCTGGNILLAATDNPAYTYVWKLNGNPITGATASSLNVNAAGNYSVTATSGACSGTQNVAIAVVAPPVASISATGATIFCSGGSVLLDAGIGSSYSYQWYNGAAPIAGATAATYSATGSGSYSVKVSAGATCQATSTAVAVTANPTPLATITTVGSTSFCSGSSVQFNASTGTGYTYQWSKGGSPISGAINSSYTATTSGVYGVVTTIGTCSSNPSTITVTVLPSPSVNISPAASTIPKFQTQTLTGSGAVSYNWSSLPDMVSNTPTSGTYRPLTTTTYTVEGTAGNGCKSTGTATITVIGCGDVTNITSTVYSPSRVLVKWTNPASVTTDTLQYRKVGATVWSRVFVTGSEYELNGLEPNASYEYNVIPLCTTTSVYIPSTTQAFSTPALEKGLYIRLLPNPAVSTTRLEIISSTSYSLTVFVYDNTGKMVLEPVAAENLPAGQVIKQLNVDRLSSGLYHVAVWINKKVHNVNLIVGR
jgi:hypothetical protein